MPPRRPSRSGRAEQVKKQNIDITNFEAELEGFKSAFGRNYDLAKRKFDTAITEIDKAIDRPQKVKDACSAPRTTCAWPTTRRPP